MPLSHPLLPAFFQCYEWNLLVLWSTHEFSVHECNVDLNLISKCETFLVEIWLSPNQTSIPHVLYNTKHVIEQLKLFWEVQFGCQINGQLAHAIIVIILCQRLVMYIGIKTMLWRTTNKSHIVTHASTSCVLWNILHLHWHNYKLWYYIIIWKWCIHSLWWNLSIYQRTFEKILTSCAPWTIHQVWE